MKQKIVVLFIITITLTVIRLEIFNKDLVTINNKVFAIDNSVQPNSIKTATPSRKDFLETCQLFGRVESMNTAKIIALEQGKIVSIAVKDTTPVKKGELLFHIGGAFIKSRLNVLHNRLDTLQERITLAKQMVKIKKDAIAQRLGRNEDLISAKDSLIQLENEIESVRQDIRRTEEINNIRAPFNGVFTHRQVSLGQEVKKGDYLAEIISQNNIYIVATLFPKDEKIKLKNKRAIINLPSGNSIQGTVASVLPQRTHEGASIIWIEGSNFASILRIGQRVAGTLVISIHKKVLAIPQVAIVRDDKENPYVFVKDSSGYHRTLIKTGIISDGWVEVISGITEGDTVVVKGAYELFYRDFNKIYKVVD